MGVEPLVCIPVGEMHERSFRHCGGERPAYQNITPGDLVIQLWGDTKTTYLIIEHGNLFVEQT
jgi:hypothetical protein